MDVLWIMCGEKDDQSKEKQWTFTCVNVKIVTFHDLMFKKYITIKFINCEKSFFFLLNYLFKLFELESVCIFGLLLARYDIVI